MSARRGLWFVLIAVLMLGLVGLGCSVCPLIPDGTEVSETEEPTDEPDDTEEPTDEPTDEPTEEPTREPPAGMVAYTNPTAGFSVNYSEDWVVEEEAFGAYFYPEDDLEGEVFVNILGGPPDEVGDSSGYGAVDSPQDLMDMVLEELESEDDVTIGDIESDTFGDVPGLRVEVSWYDSWDEAQYVAHLIVAANRDVMGLGIGVAFEEDWPTYDLLFMSMFDSLVFFEPEPPPEAEGGQIFPGQTTRATLPPGGEAEWYFDADAGQYVSIRVDAVDPDDLDPYMELYDEEGVYLTHDDDGGDGTNVWLAEYRLDDGGTYYIYVSAYEGSGDYDLTVELADSASGGGEIEIGETVTGVLPDGVEHEWRFEGQAGDVITIRMNALDDELDCYVELYDPDDWYVDSDDDGGEDYNSLLEDVELEMDGTYSIWVSDVAGGGGSYELILE